MNCILTYVNMCSVCCIYLSVLLNCKLWHQVGVGEKLSCWNIPEGH